MTAVDRLSYLRVVLVLAGLACLALYPLMLFWPSGWAWHDGHSDYPMMMVGIYGCFVHLDTPLAIGRSAPDAQWSLIVHSSRSRFAARLSSNVGAA